MSDNEPKDRLRSARTRLGLSREQLATKLGRAASTVRAHENGQNQILPDAAAAYARELGVSPAWLLYGSEDQPAKVQGPRTKLVPVVGEIWERSHFTPAGEIYDPGEEPFFTISLPEYAAEEDVRAYLYRSADFAHRVRKYVITAALPLDELTLVDEVVLRSREGRLVETAIWRVGAAEAGWRFFYQGATQTTAQRIIKLRAGDERPGFGDDNAEEGASTPSTTLIGVVIARAEVRRRAPS